MTRSPVGRIRASDSRVARYVRALRWRDVAKARELVVQMTAGEVAAAMVELSRDEGWELVASGELGKGAQR
ncbi:hypothetical protein KJ925_04835 [Patescibacteria group bacterium]|nr:hypothetical protein [Patescibacteria group bacterium]